jgi:hypothetical protein
MDSSTTRPSRSEIVRKRRTQMSKERVTSASKTATASGRPLVSRPRKVVGQAPTPTLGKNRRRFEIALPGGLALHAPTLPRLNVSWRLASLSLVILLSGMLARLMTDPRMFVDGINLGGAALVPGEEIFAESGLARQHMFWVNPAAAQARIAAIPGIASAQVSVTWPNIVTVVVVERVPVATWIEGDQKWWVDAQGLKFQARGDLASLLPVTVDDVPAGAMANAPRPVPVEAIQGALQLKQLRPNIELLHYDAQHGLSYQDGRHWRGYFGVGPHMDQKLAVYETLVASLMARGIQPAMISVENPLAAYYRK